MRLQRAVFHRVLTMGRLRLGRILPRSPGGPPVSRGATTATVLAFPVIEPPLDVEPSLDTPLDDVVEIWEQLGEWVQPALFVARVDDD